MQLTLISIALALLVVWLYMRRRNQSKATEEPIKPKASENTAFHAVSIKFDAQACDAAKEMGGRRFLSNAAPRLPLPECNTLECRCRFSHHKDRRANKDRRSPFSGGVGGGTGSFKKERRESRDRRKDTDLDLF